MPAGTLASWAWKLREEARDVSLPSPFVELVAKPSELDGRIEVLLANGRRVVVTNETDEDQLVRVVRALERC